MNEKGNLLIFFLMVSYGIPCMSQCSFQYISNDTSYQDYFDFIYTPRNQNQIITIGGRLNRKTSNSKQFNAVLFETFDYCGNIQIKEVYSNIDRYKIKHLAVPTHNTYLDEPVGNFVVSVKDNDFLIVDKAIDTVTLEQVLILLRVNENGQLQDYKTLSLSVQEANQNVVKNVLQLQSGDYLIILWDNSLEYYFYYFDKDLNFKIKKSFSLGRGIRSIKEINNGQFICSSLAYDISSFQFYKFDTTGEIKWIITPYNNFGSIRDLQIIDDKIYITGGTMGFGVFMICDSSGNILNEFKYDTLYCNLRFCSAIIDPEKSATIGGYIKHCDQSDKRGTDVSIMKIDMDGKILFNTVYDFRSQLGTSGEGGFYSDYGGFSINTTNDSGIITNGISKYTDIQPGNTGHIDALLIKTESIAVSSKNVFQLNDQLHFEIFENPIRDNLKISGPIEHIKYWTIYSFVDGKEIIHGNYWSNALNIMTVRPGLYYIDIKDRFKNSQLLKFIKI